MTETIAPLVTRHSQFPSWTRRIWRGAVCTLPQITVALSALLVVRILSEQLNPKELGSVMLSLTGLSLLDALVSSPLSQAAFYFASQQPAAVRRLLLVFATRTSYIGSLICVAILRLALDEPEPSGPLQIGFLSVFFVGYVFTEPKRSVTLATLNHLQCSGRYGALIMIESLANVSLSALILSRYPSLVGVLFLTLFTRAISSALGLALVRRPLDHTNDGESHITTMDIVRYSLPFTLMGVLGWAMAFLDRYVIGAVLGIGAAGVYAVVSGLAYRPYGILSATLTVRMRPKVFNAVGNGEKRLARIHTLHWIRDAALVGGLGAVAAYLFSEYVVQLLLGTTYHAVGAQLLPIFSLVGVTTALAHAIDNRILASGKATQLLYFQGIALPIGLTMTGVAGVAFGLYGAVWMRAGVGALVFLALIIWFKHLEPSSSVERGNSDAH